MSETSRFFYLLFICFVAALGGFLFGFDTGVVSGLTQSVETQFELTPFWKGWFVSSVLVGCILGASMAGIASDRFGRKAVLLFSGLLFFFTSLGCGYPPNLFWLVIFRLVGGIGVGVASMVAPLYISEMSPPKLRGRLVTLFQLAVCFGVFASYASNTLIHKLPEKLPALFAPAALNFIFVAENWRGMFLMECLPAAVYFLMILFVPESPRWWAARGEDEKALDTLRKILGEEEARLEMREIRAVLNQKTGKFSELFSTKLGRGLIIGMLLMFFSQVTGINVMVYFGTENFSEIGFSKTFSFYLQTVVGLANIGFTILAICTIDRWGRKPLLKIGTCVIFCTLTLIAALFYLKSHGGNETLLLWLFPVLNVLFIAAFAMSWGPIPWVIVSEIFPARIRGRAASVGTMTIWISCFLVVQTFPLIKDIAPEICFAIYAAFMIPAIFFVWFMVPETKGVSLEELEKELYS